MTQPGAEVEGFVVSYNESGGFGFIRPVSASSDVRTKSVFDKASSKDHMLFRQASVEATQLPRLVPGQRVRFRVTDERQDLWTVVDRVRVVSLDESSADLADLEAGPEAEVEYVDHYADYDDFGWPKEKSGY